MLKKTPLFLILAVIGAILYSLGSQIYNALQAGKRLDETVSQLTHLQKRNLELKKKLVEVGKPEFIEKLARDKLNLARPNETVVIIPEEQLNKVLSFYNKDKMVKLPNWLGWFKLFFD